MKYLLLPALMLLCAIHLHAQTPKPDSSFYGTFDKGIDYIIRSSYDSALTYFKKAVAIGEAQKLYKEEKFSAALNNVGLCYKELAMPTEAHEYMYRSLLNTRIYRHIVHENNALLSLNNLHWSITKNNWSFAYPKAATTSGSYLFFPIEKTMPYNADSIMVVVYAGSNDGINDSSYPCNVYKRYDTIYRNHPDVSNGISLANGSIKTIEPNRTFIVVKKTSNLPIEAFDQVNIYCQTPVDMKKSHFADLFQYGINFSDFNKADMLISRRFLYYYADSMVNFEFIKILKQQIFEVQKAYASDTLKTTSLLAQKAASGIFKGLNIIKAMDSSGTRHLLRFIHFMAVNPGSYFGNNFSFAEVYATWLLNNAPLKPDDVLDYLFTVPDERRLSLTGALMEQIQSNNLVDKWVTDGLNYLDQDDLLDIKGIYIALKNVYLNNKDASTRGWYYFFIGMYNYKSGDIETADSLLTKATNFFVQANNNEGTAISKQAIHKIHESNKVTLQVDGASSTMAKRTVLHPSGKYYATCHGDQIIHIWNLELGKETRSINQHKDEVLDICFSPNGRLMATCSRDNTIKIWNTFDYSLVSTINTNNTEYCVAFSPNNKTLASGGRDSLVKLWNVASSKLLFGLRKHKASVNGLCFMPNNENILYSCGLDSFVYKWNLTTKEDVHWYKKKARMMSVKVNYDGSYLFYTATDTTINVWNILKNEFYFQRKLSFKKMGSSNFGEADFSPDGKLLIYPDRENNLSLVDLSADLIATIPTNEPSGQYLNSVHFTPNQKSIFATYPFYPKRKLFNFSNYKSIRSIDFTSFKSKSFTDYTNPPFAVQFSNDGKSLYVISDRLSKLDLTNGATQYFGYSPQAVYNETIMLNDSISLQTQDEDKVVLQNQKTSDIRKEIGLSSNDTLVCFHPDNLHRTMFIAGKHGLVEAFAMTDTSFEAKPIFSVHIKLPPTERLVFFQVDTFRNQLLVRASNDSLYIINYQQGRLTNIVPGGNNADVVATPQYLYFNNYDGTISKKNAMTFQLIKKIKVGNDVDAAGYMKASLDYKKIIAFINEKEFVVIDTKADTVLYTRRAHESLAIGLAISPDNKYLATSGFDNKVSLFNLQTGEKLLNIFTPLGLDFVLSDTAGNYMASKKSLEGLSFKYNDKIYGFDQFDIKFNRPDIILPKTGRADTAMAAAYKKAFEKRIRKAGFTSEASLKSTELPFISISDKTDVELFTNLGNTEIGIECSDAKYPIQAVHVLVNNNPVFGLAGKPLGSRSMDTMVNLKIPLAYGENRIKIYCTNNQGQESLQQGMEINSSHSKNPYRKTWFIGIGVSDYKDKDMSLRYAAKDIRDLVGTFTKDKDTANISIDTLINQNATLANIMALKKKILQADINDRVIVAVTGHGLLNKSLDFYYATYDVDFNNPEQKGLKYEALESLLDGVPAQHKLLLIDACHSGALDKETLLSSKGTVIEKVNSADSGTVKSTRSTIKVKPSKVNLNNTFELMRNLFADFSNSNGTVVISAAGGLEYAFESPQWSNGVFTYCVRKAIENKEADRYGTGNHDGNISVQELMKYVSAKVAELTNGRQKPTSRRESLEFDWNLR